MSDDQQNTPNNNAATNNTGAEPKVDEAASEKDVKTPPASAEKVQTANRDDALKAALDGHTSGSAPGAQGSPSPAITAGASIYIQSMIQNGDWNNIESVQAQRFKIDQITSVIQRAENDRIGRIFEPPTQFDETYKLLNSIYLIILHGEQRTGKLTASIRMLAILGCARMLRFDDAISLNDLQNFDFEADTGYILYSPAKLNDCSETVVSRIQAKLSKLTKSYFVVVTTEEKSIRSDIKQTYAREWKPTYDRAKMLKNHLTPSSDEERPQLDECLQRTDVISVAVSLQYPYEVEEFANLLRRVARKEFLLDVALQHFQAFGDQQMIKWLDDLPEDGQVFVTALSVLQECPVSEQYDCAKSLCEAVCVPVSDPARTGSFLRLSRSEIETRTLARFSTMERHTEAGSGSVDTLKWIQPEYAGKILALVWKQRPYLRPDLLSWLKDLVDHRSPAVRSSAAISIGRLVDQSFEDCYRSVLLDLALSPDVVHRSAAGLALAVAALGEEEKRVMNLLHSWSRGDNVRLCWTAAFAYGCGGAVRQPERAMEDLLHILDYSDLGLIPDTLVSIKRIFMFGSINRLYYAVVLNQLDFHYEEGDYTRLIPWPLVLFTVMMEIPCTSQDREYPAFLKILDENEDCRTKVAALLLKAWNRQETRIPVLANMKKWMDEADKRKSIFRMVTKLIYSAAVLENQQTRYRGNIQYQLEKWSAEGYPAAKEIRRRIFPNA